MSSEAGRGSSAGALLRAAREKQGLHIAALAASIKVAPRKLEALEGDRYEELPGATFTRALAQTICRSLRIDPQPVLALLPKADAAELDQVGGRLNTPFRDRPSRLGPGLTGIAPAPLVWAGAALLLGAVLIYVAPSSWYLPAARPVPAAVVATPAASAVMPAVPVESASATAAGSADAVGAGASAMAQAMTQGGVVQASTQATNQAAAEPAASATQVEITYNAPAGQGQSTAPAGAGMLQLSTRESSWVEVRDKAGRILLSRTVQPGEAVGLDGALPMRLTVGNAAVTQATFRGRPVDLAASARENVARIELN